MNEVIHSIFAFGGFCILFIVIAFFVNRKRLIQKYNLDNDIPPIPSIDDVKPPINVWKVLFLSSIGSLLILLAILSYTANREKPTYTFFSPKEIISLSKLSQKELAKACMNKGFIEIYNEANGGAQFKTYQKQNRTKDEGISYESIKYYPDSMGKLFYIFADPYLYNQFIDSIKNIKKDLEPKGLERRYKSNYKQIYSNGCFVRECGYRIKNEGYTIEVISIDEYEKNILKVSQKKESVKKYKNRQFVYTKGTKAIAYQAPSFSNQMFWSFYPNTKVKCIDTNGNFILVIEQTKTSYPYVGWVHKSDLRKSKNRTSRN